ncbi:hypothetical protein HN681_03745 [archaeon]|jgi:tRNA (guanine37-N1)-methyltransferase|nr:hypothetical protein [archaeon]MBT3730409.1 hypothetical protein [archaeon]MBT4670392.1 hypothetical protein [archaeon]MBT5030143.1 hypothetical protein [archaeon]MBT7053161.1 hypothetical protein [archaeon]
MKCAKTLKKNAEKLKHKLIEAKVLSRDYKAHIGKTHIYFPLSKEIKGLDITDKKCEKIEKINMNSGSYDQVGDIVILSQDAKKSDAKEILKRSNIKVVLRRKGNYSGEFRTLKLDYLAGEKRKETIHKENGVQMKLNPEEVYFSPRLSTERLRVASLVKDGEKVLVLFSGVAPYPLVIAKHSNPKLIVAVEKNPIGHKYALENCKKYSNIELYNEDAKTFTHKEKFDRILMPLPKSAEDFLDNTKKLIKKNGIIHFYDFLNEKDIPDHTIETIKKHIKKFKVLHLAKCGQYGPGKLRICLDIKLT